MRNTSSVRKVGIFQVALSGLFFGFLGLFGKRLLDGGWTIGELLSVRFLFSAALLWPFIIVRSPTHGRLPISQIVLCFLLGACGYAVFSSWYFIALKGVSASLAVLLLYLYPILVAGFAWIVWKEKIPKQKWPAIPLAMIGLVLLIWGEFSVEKASALFFGIGAAVVYAVYILASSRLLHRTEPLVSLTYIQTFAGLILAAINWQLWANLERLMTLTIQNWIPLMGLVLIGGVGAMGLFLAGLQKLKPWEVSLLSMLEPVVGVTMATLVLGEPLGFMKIAGGLLVLGSLALVSLPNRKATRASN